METWNAGQLSEEDATVLFLSTTLLCRY